MIFDQNEVKKILSDKITVNSVINLNSFISKLIQQEPDCKSIDLIRSDSNGLYKVSNYKKHYNSKLSNFISLNIGDSLLSEIVFELNDKIRIEYIVNYFNKNINKCQKLSKMKNKGGSIRGKKGDALEQIAQLCCEASIHRLNKNKDHEWEINKESFDVIHTKDPSKKYSMIADRLLSIDGTKCLQIESKTYADLSMYKRTLMDAYLIQKNYPQVDHVLFELEKGMKENSESSDTVESYFDIKIHKFSLFNNLRNSSRTIHSEEFRKNIDNSDVERAICFFSEILKRHF